MSTDDLTRIAASLPGYRDRTERSVTTDADLCRTCGHLAAQHEHLTRSTRCSAMQCGCLRPARTRWWHRLAAAAGAWLVEDSPTDPPLTKADIAAGAPTNVFAAWAEAQARRVERAR